MQLDPSQTALCGQRTGFRETEENVARVTPRLHVHVGGYYQRRVWADMTYGYFPSRGDNREQKAGKWECDVICGGKQQNELMKPRESVTPRI